MNGCWLSFPINDHLLNQDLAIRRFCPARVEQEQGSTVGEQYCGDQEEEDDRFYDHISVLWSPTHHTSTCGTPHLPTSEKEEEQFVDSFFNTDCYSPEEEQHHSLFDHNTFLQDNFSMSIDDIYQDNIPSMIKGNYLEMSSSYEDTEALSEILVPDAAAAATTTTTTTTASLEETSQGVDQGLHLVHMLLACAEAVGCRDTPLADSMLTQMWSLVSPWGDSLQRVSYCFAMGLRSRLSLLRNNVNANGTFTNDAMDVSLITRQEKIEAFHLLHQTTPYIAFGFMAANEAIFQAAQGNDSFHIIDLGMEHTLQWPSFIRTLASRNIEGTTGSVRTPPIKLVRITGIIGDQDPMDIQSSMKTVMDDANSLGIPFEFSTIAGPATPSLLTRENLKLREGETLFVNSIMHLHKYVKESRGCLKKILEAIKKLGPTLLTVVEQDANHNGPFFLGRFLESLHYYSAIFDSLEASLPRNSRERMKIEKLHFAEEIRNIVAYEGSDRMERHERWDQWRRQLGRGGFQMVGFKCWSEVKMMAAFVNNYGCDGYTVASDKDCLLLGWKGRPIMLASAWQLHN